jgi:hypothetical protein
LPFYSNQFFIFHENKTFAWKIVKICSKLY